MDGSDDTYSLACWRQGRDCASNWSSSNRLVSARYPVLGPPAFRTFVTAKFEDWIPLRGIRTDKQTAMSRRKGVTDVLTANCYRCLDPAWPPQPSNSK